jgi:CheY-like chemotaxis protein
MARILVVEDERNIRYLVTTLLRKRDHNVTEAENGLEALDILKNDHTYDIVVTDMQMPLVDGVTLIETIKLNYPKMYIIAISAYSDTLEGIHTKGADSIIRKPFSAHQLVDVIHFTVGKLIAEV